MAGIGDLFAKIGFNVDLSPLEHLQEKVEHVQHSLELISGVEILRGIFEISERFSSVGEALESASVSAGLTAEEFQALGFAASQNAVSQEELGGALGKLARNLGEAREGSQSAIDAFARLGIDKAQFDTFGNAGDALEALADKIKEIPDPIARTTAVMGLLGRGSNNMVKFLSQGGSAIDALKGRAKSMGAVVSNEGVHSLAELEDSLSAFGTVIKSITATFAAEFAPSIIDMTHWVGELVSQNQGLLGQDFSRWSYRITFALGYMFGVFEDIINVIGALKERFDYAFPGMTDTFGEVAFGLIGLNFAFAGIQKSIGLVEGAAGLAEGGFNLLMLAATPFTALLGLIQGGVANAVIAIGGMVATAFPALGAAIADIGVILWALPITWVIGGIALIGIAIHDLWALFNGKKFSETWLGQAFDKITSVGSGVLKFFGLADTETKRVETKQKDGTTKVEYKEETGFPLLRAAFPGDNEYEGDPLRPSQQRLKKKKAYKVPGQADASTFSMMQEFAQPPADFVTRAPAPELVLAAQPAPMMMGPPAPANMSIALNSPITINVPAGLDVQAVGEMVSKKIIDHRDEQLRAAQVSQTAAMRY